MVPHNSSHHSSRSRPRSGGVRLNPAGRKASAEKPVDQEPLDVQPDGVQPDGEKPDGDKPDVAVIDDDSVLDDDPVLDDDSVLVDDPVLVDGPVLDDGVLASDAEQEADTVQTLLHHEVAAAVAAEQTSGEPAIVERLANGVSVESPAGGFPESTVDVEELVAGLIAAHDLASIPGSTAIQVQLERTLRAAGLSRIQVQTGQPFDPNEQMVAAVEPAPTEEQDRCVAREIRSGWKRRDLVVRPAEVAVWTTS